MKYLTLSLLLLLFYLGNGQTWQTTSIESNPGGQRYDDVFFLNDNVGWAANGYYATVYKTVDGGLNWTQQLSQEDLGGDYYFRNICFLNEDMGFLGTLNARFFKTLDGGESWTAVSNISPNPPAICGLDAIGPNTIYGCGAYFTPAFVIKSTDQGETWIYRDLSSLANALVEIQFINEDIGYAGGSNEEGAVVLKTIDGGENWFQVFNSGVPGQYVWKLQYLESVDAIFGSIESVAPTSGKLIKSFDGGENWQVKDAPEIEIQAVGFLDANRGWMGGHNTGIFETLDGGDSWNFTEIGSNLNRIQILSSGEAVAAGTSIYKFSEASLATRDIVEANSSKLKVDLLDNPVSEELTFTIDFPSSDNVLMEIFSINGAYIKKLGNDHIPAGQNRAYAFNVSLLEAGIYFLTIHNNYNRFTIPFIKD